MGSSVLAKRKLTPWRPTWTLTPLACPTGSPAAAAAPAGAEHAETNNAIRHPQTRVMARA